MGELQTVDLKGEQIFSTGEFNGDRYTEQDLDQIIQSFNALKGRLDPPVKLGHNEEQPESKEFARQDGRPAMGWVERLYRKGTALYADITGVPAKLAEVLKAGAYKKKSAEIYWNFKDNGQTYSRALKAISFLGADIPANRNIGSLQTLYDEQGNEYRVAVYAEWSTEAINDLPDAAFAAIMPGGKKDEGGKTVPRSLRMLPHHTAGVTSPTDNESVDLPHLRNALARLKQADMPAAMMRRAMSHLEAHAKALRVGEREMAEINQTIKEVTQHMNELEELTRKYTEMESKNAELAGQVKAFAEKLSAVEAKAGDAEAARTKAEADAKTYAERLAATEKSLADEKKARRLSELRSVASAFPHIPGTVEEKADKLYRLESVDAKFYDERVAEWRALNEQIGNGDLFSQHSYSGERPGSSSAKDRMDAAISEALKQGRAKTLPEATALVCQEQPRLYSEYQREHEARARHYA